MDTIAVIDLGDQYTQQLANAVRKAGVFSEILPFDTSYDEIVRKGYKGVIFSGSPDFVDQEGSRKCDKRFFSDNVTDMLPKLGVCYGHQLMAYESGGTVGRAEQGEYGQGTIRILNHSPLFNGLDEYETVLMSHGQSVLELPHGYETIAVSSNGLVAAMANEKKKTYGVQFHPEVAHTPKGLQIVKNFAIDICEAKPEWTMKNYIASKIEQIQNMVGDGYIISLVSGGVDSTVATLLAQRALGKDRVIGVHIDTGIERKNEAKNINKFLAPAGITVKVIDGTDYTLDLLRDVIDPEKKRHILGDAFVQLLDNRLGNLVNDKNAYVMQGTIYPDRIESKGGIKSHHNVASELIMALDAAGRLIEPNGLLFKDEVRDVGWELGLQREHVGRHPYPGPGLGVRHVGRVLKPGDYAATCASVSEILGQYGLEGAVVPIGTVGVKGSAREDGNLVEIYGAKEDYKIAARLSTMLPDKFPGITRGTLVLDGKRHTQDEWDSIRQMPITRESLRVLREADAIAMDNLVEFGYYDTISQMPVVLFPGPGDENWLAFRPVITPNFMTASIPEMGKDISWEYFEKTIRDINKELPIDGHIFDLTPKPPGTIEWE